MTHNDLKKEVKTIHGGLSVNVAIHQSSNNVKVFTDIIVSSLTDFVKYVYIDKELCFVHGVAYVSTIEKMKKLFIKEDVK